MSTTAGPNTPNSSVETNPYFAPTTWTNPTDANSGNDGTPATITLDPSTFQTALVVLTDFDFTLPADSYVIDVGLEVRCKLDVIDNSVYIQILGWGPSGQTGGGSAIGSITDSFTWIPVAGPFIWTDWTIDTTLANNVNFGFALAPANVGADIRTLSVSNARLTLTYVTDGGSIETVTITRPLTFGW